MQGAIQRDATKVKDLSCCCLQQTIFLNFSNSLQIRTGSLSLFQIIFPSYSIWTTQSGRLRKLQELTVWVLNHVGTSDTSYGLGIFLDLLWENHFWCHLGHWIVDIHSNTMYYLAGLIWLCAFFHLWCLRWCCIEVEGAALDAQSSVGGLDPTNKPRCFSNTCCGCCCW